MATCTTNINPLYNSYFSLVFGRGTSQMELLCQKANLPGISVPDQPQPTTLGVNIPVPTLAANFEQLNVEFIVDSDMTNWKSLFSWIRNITNITDSTSFDLNYQDWHHSASLFVYNSTNNCVMVRADFHYIIPTALSGIVFQSDSADAIIQKATCRFKYSYFDLWNDDSDAVPNNLKNQR